MMSKKNNFSKRLSRYFVPGVLGVLMVYGIASGYLHTVSSGQEIAPDMPGAVSVLDHGIPNPYSPELKDVFFDRDSAEIRADAKPVLDENVSVLKESPEIYVVIEPYCEAGEISTDALGADRANSIKDYFVDMGINPDRIITADECQTSAKGLAAGKDEFELERRVNFIPIDRVLDKDAFAAKACCKDSGRKGLIN
jgi:outer membrane protein OmpA-like peptidoglycan-associated protein